jgi:hypothetical protein
VHVLCVRRMVKAGTCVLWLCEAVHRSTLQCGMRVNVTRAILT